MRWLKLTTFFSLILFLIGATVTVSGDFDQDLGRHIKLGEVMWKTFHVVTSNLFSYTNPSFPFVDHHWLFEAFAYPVMQLTGPMPLLIIKILCMCSAFLLLTWVAYKKWGALVAFSSSLLVAPLFLERTYLRPEVFGYVFFAILLSFLISDFKRKWIKLGISLGILALWSNIHITFIFGVFLLGLMMLKEGFLFKMKKTEYKKWGIFVFFGIISMFANPQGIKGFLYPLFIFNNYGYPIVENQNMFYLHQVTNNPLITYFFVLSPLVLIAIVVLLCYKKILESFILAVFFVLPLFQIRHMPFFVLTGIPLLALSLSYIKPFIKKYQLEIRIGAYSLVSILFFVYASFLISNTYYRTFDSAKEFGLGFTYSYKPAADFILKNNLAGPLFNNFDIGGYLDYRLYPTYSTYVDNRPEAFPTSFMEEKYIGLEQNDTVRQTLFNKYHIQTVVVNHTDQTPWGQTFLKNMLADAHFKLIYFDYQTVIFSRSSSLPDMRSNTQYISRLISQSDNYLQLLFLLQFVAKLNNLDMAMQIYQKAADINPSSCTIVNIEYTNLSSNPLYTYRAEQLKQDHWYCFH